jgi:hypothetical protein
VLEIRAEFEAVLQVLAPETLAAIRDTTAETQAEILALARAEVPVGRAEPLAAIQVAVRVAPVEFPVLQAKALAAGVELLEAVPSVLPVAPQKVESNRNADTTLRT